MALGKNRGGEFVPSLLLSFFVLPSCLCALVVNFLLLNTRQPSRYPELAAEARRLDLTCALDRNYN
jgi:hypothetical protein